VSAIDPKVEDRLRGMLYGLAVGDALGQAVEFKAPGTFSKVTGYRGGGVFGLEPGEWTDDTSMALALADSISEVGWDLEDQLRNYVAWWKDGKYSVNGRCFDIGGQTAKALSLFADEEWPAAMPWEDKDLCDPKHSGNGSVMRLAPAVIAYPAGVARWEESSKTTHPSEPCVSACSLLGSLLSSLAAGVDRDQILSHFADQITLNRARAAPRPGSEDVLEVFGGSYRTCQPVASGWVVRTLEAALWAFHDAKDFRTAVLKAVNLGDDADSVGAVCGQLAGAFWGYRAIPKPWVDGLARRDMIDEALEGLLRVRAATA
jgi:ADP-ribosyl-[dinitrogen reductase] hydrolase